MRTIENVLQDAEDIYTKYKRRFFKDEKSDKLLGLMDTARL